MRSAIIANSNIEATQIDSSTSIFIPQGGACDLGISGINDLCSELESFILPIFHTDKKKWKVNFSSLKISGMNGYVGHMLDSLC